MPLRSIIGLTAVLGLAGVLPVSIDELRSGGSCPHLGIVPACYLVTAAYTAILFSVLRSQFWSARLFLSGWIPIFLFAAIGSGFEISGAEACPKTQGGVPMCFLSMGLAVELAAPFLVHLWTTSRRSQMQ